MQSGFHPSLHPNCHHQITYAEFNLKIHYPPLYEREIWHHRKTNTDQIKKKSHSFLGTGYLKILHMVVLSLTRKNICNPIR